MTAHILYPSVDPGSPATMSHELVTTILRGELGYRGAVVSDDIGMRAVSSMFDEPDAAARVISSGTDLITICSHWTGTDRSYSLVDNLERARRDGSLAETALAAADGRIETLLAAAPTHMPRLLHPDIVAAHARRAPLYPKRRRRVRPTTLALFTCLRFVAEHTPGVSSRGRALGWCRQICRRGTR